MLPRVGHGGPSADRAQTQHVPFGRPEGRPSAFATGAEGESRAWDPRAPEVESWEFVHHRLAQTDTDAFRTDSISTASSAAAPPRPKAMRRGKTKRVVQPIFDHPQLTPSLRRNAQAIVRHQLRQAWPADGDRRALTATEKLAYREARGLVRANLFLAVSTPPLVKGVKEAHEVFEALIVAGLVTLTDSGSVALPTYLTHALVRAALTHFDARPKAFHPDLALHVFWLLNVARDVGLYEYLELQKIYGFDESDGDKAFIPLSFRNFKTTEDVVDDVLDLVPNMGGQGLQQAQTRQGRAQAREQRMIEVTQEFLDFNRAESHKRANDLHAPYAR